MVPVISDFLFDNAGAVMKELSLLNAMHDVFIVLIDSAFAFELPSISAGWIEAFDVETGRSQRDVARRAAHALGAHARVAGRGRAHGEGVGPRRPAHRRRRAADRDRPQRVHRRAATEKGSVGARHRAGPCEMDRCGVSVRGADPRVRPRGP